MPGTPSMLAGSSRPCQCTEVNWSARALRTRTLTVSPSRQRSVGAGSDWLTVMALRARPVRLTGMRPICSAAALPRRTAGVA